MSTSLVTAEHLRSSSFLANARTDSKAATSRGNQKLSCSKGSKKGRWSGGRNTVPSASATGMRLQRLHTTTESRTEATSRTEVEPVRTAWCRPCGKGRIRFLSCRF